MRVKRQIQNEQQAQNNPSSLNQLESNQQTPINGGGGQGPAAVPVNTVNNAVPNTNNQASNNGGGAQGVATGTGGNPAPSTNNQGSNNGAAAQGLPGGTGTNAAQNTNNPLGSASETQYSFFFWMLCVKYSVRFLLLSR